MLSEYVEDQGRPVDDLDLDPVLEVAQLGGVELAVANDSIGPGSPHHLGKFCHLARTDICRRIRGGPTLHDGFEYLRTSRLSKSFQLRHSVLGVGGGPLRPHRTQHHPFQPQLTVLDFGNIRQISRHTRDTGQR